MKQQEKQASTVNCIEVFDQIQRAKGDIVRLSDWQRHFDNLQKKGTLRHAHAKSAMQRATKSCTDRSESEAETSDAAWA
jgi:hypothetical protein